MRGRPREPVEPRFWRYVDKNDASGCWLWTGVTVAGYGRLSVNGQHVSTHVLSYQMHYGPIPKGLWVLHKCDVRRCVRPDHLFLGTQQDNNADALRKGRLALGRRGEMNLNSKLTAVQVKEIRAGYTGRYGNRVALARQFNVTPEAIGAIVHGKVWRESA